MTEGEFDAKSLNISNLFGCALGGKNIEENQIEMIRGYIPVLCFDTDSNKKVDAGGKAMLDIGNELKAKGFEEVWYIRPPKQYKDWNKMLVDVGPKIVNAYIKQNQKKYTDMTGLTLTIQKS